MEKCVIRITGSAMPGLPCPEAGCFVASMDVEAHGGIGHLYASKRIRDAKVFDHPAKALSYYQRSPQCRPLRPDGHPNRPLTAYNVEILPWQMDTW